MAQSSRIARWLRTIGWHLGICSVEAVAQVPGSGKTQRRAAREAYRRLENDRQARLLVRKARNGSRLTAGELSERAQRRLTLIGSGHQ